MRRQAYYWYMQFKLGAISFADLMKRIKKLSLPDWAGLFASVIDRESWARLRRMLGSRNDSKVQKVWHGLCPLDGVLNIKDFKDWAAKDRLAKAGIHGS